MEQSTKLMKGWPNFRTGYQPHCQS